MGVSCDHYPRCIRPHCTGTPSGLPSVSDIRWPSLETCSNLFTSGSPLLRLPKNTDTWWLLKHVQLAQVGGTHHTVTLSCFNCNYKVDVVLSPLKSTACDWCKNVLSKFPAFSWNNTVLVKCTLILFCRSELSLKLKVFAKFPQTRRQCQESLLVVPSTTPAVTLPYCSQTTESLYRNDVEQYRVLLYPDKILTFTHSKNFVEGGKYNLQVEGSCISIHLSDRWVVFLVCGELKLNEQFSEQLMRTLQDVQNVNKSSKPREYSEILLWGCISLFNLLTWTKPLEWDSMLINKTTINKQ